MTLTGRDKEVIIINGANFHAYEVESVVDEVSTVEVSFSTAIGVFHKNSDREEMAVFFVSKNKDEQNLKDTILKVRAALAQKVGVNPKFIIPVSKDDIPKTSIGKIQRSLLKQRFESGYYDEIVQGINHLISFESNDIYLENQLHSMHEKEALSVFQDKLDINNVPLNKSFYEIGLSSIQMIQFLNEINNRYSFNLQPSVLLEYSNLRDFSLFLESKNNTTRDNEVNMYIEQF